MAIDPDNVNLWADADVFTAPVGTAIPASSSTPFSGSWAQLGILDGGDGFASARTETVTDHFGWGGMLIKTSRKDFKLVYKFSTLEDNAATRALRWPGSTVGVIKVPVPQKTKIAFETRDSNGKVHRMISRNYALIEVASDLVENETDPAKTQFTATIFPDADGVLFDEQSTASIASIAITALVLALSMGGATIGKLVATATYSDATTGDISDLALWSTSAPAKATVSDGYVTAVAIGSANVSCSYGGVVATAPCVVTVSA